MRSKTASVAQILVGLALFCLFPMFVVGQSDEEKRDISPINPAGPCNITVPAIVDSDPRKDADVTPDLLRSGLPCSPVLVAKFTFPNLQHGFDFYSWLTFIDLNAPASPAAGSVIGPDVTTKWERYKQLPDVMLHDGSDPGEWKDNNTVFPAKCQALAGPDKLVIHIEEETFNQPFKTGPLIDQNGHYALFTIFMNRPMYEYIRVNKLYNVEGQRAFTFGTDRFSGSTFPAGTERDPVTSTAAITNFPNGRNFVDKDRNRTGQGTVGSLMVKVSWKILAGGDRREDFHTKQAVIYTPPSPDGRIKEDCVEMTVGMIGFHVAHKTVDQHQWVWTTFEHVKNVPTQAEVDDAGKKHVQIGGGPYNFFNPGCDASKCLINQTPPRPWHPALQGTGRDFKFRDGYKSQITRVISLETDVKDRLNKNFQSILPAGTVWKNYMLVSTQWPTLAPCRTHSNTRNQVDPTCAPAPFFLANTTLETYSQGRTPMASSSCIACHGNATTQHVPATPSDFTFILEKAKKKAH